MKDSTYEAVIGLEVHAQLATESKIFSASSASYGGEANSQVDPVCMGLPGVLPTLNRQAVDFALRMALATNCQVAGQSIFARKHYFYPDLPKGYQISQFEQPLAQHGFLDIEYNGESRRIRIRRIHLEEDAGKSIHAEVFVRDDETLIDLNRCGVPLIEIVSEPDFHQPEETSAYLTDMRQLLQYLEICDGNMEEGSLRCDANISVRRAGAQLGTKTELKNMNSISGVENAVRFEIKRQIDILAAGGRIRHETLLWDADKQLAVPMRSKEYSHDYRYLPEPDLLPLQIDDTWISEVRNSLPELPGVRRMRFITELGLPEYDAELLITSKQLADYFEAVARACGDAKQASNWVMGEVLRYLKEKAVEIADFPLAPGRLADLIRLTTGGRINRQAAQKVFAEMLVSEQTPEQIVTDQGLAQISDEDAILEQVRKVLDQNPEELNKYLSGKQQLFGFFVGQVMRLTRGQANPAIVNRILRDELQARSAD